MCKYLNYIKKYSVNSLLREKQLRALGIKSKTHNEVLGHIDAETKVLTEAENRELAVKEFSLSTCEVETEEVEGRIARSKADKEATHKADIEREHIEAEGKEEVEKERLDDQIEEKTEEKNGILADIAVSKSSRFYPSGKSLIENPLTLIIVIGFFLYGEYQFGFQVFENLGMPDDFILPVTIIFSGCMGLCVHFGARLLANGQWAWGATLTLVGLCIALFLIIYLRAGEAAAISPASTEPTELIYNVAQSGGADLSDEEAAYRLRVVYSVLSLTLLVLAFTFDFLRAYRVKYFNQQKRLSAVCGAIEQLVDRKRQIKKRRKNRRALHDNAIQQRICNSDKQDSLELTRLKLQKLSLEADIKDLESRMRRIKEKVTHAIELGWLKSPYNK